VHFFCMRFNVKMASGWTFEPRGIGTSEPVVQRSPRMLLNVSSLTIPAFKINKSKKRSFHQEDICKVLSNVMEHHISLRRASNENNVD